MKRLIPALLTALFVFPATSWADDAPPSPPPAQGCGLTNSMMDGPDDVTIDCVGVSQEFAGQLAGILTYVLQRRLDPEVVIAKLDEIEGMPPAGQPRAQPPDQGQAIIKSLVGQPPAQVKIVANPDATDAGDYALAIATKLQMAGWRIADGQITRVVPPHLGDIAGIVLVVRDEKSPPDMAVRLKQALAAAKVFLPIISDPTMAKDAALLWIGKKPELPSMATQ
jgi:hypothetical protein